MVGNKLVAAARREPPLVIGDGKHTVRELVAEVNKDPRRGKGHGTSLTQIRIDAIAAACLKGQDLTPESVPPRGQRVILRHNANLSTGGTATDVTDNMHPKDCIKCELHTIDRRTFAAIYLKRACCVTMLESKGLGCDDCS